MRCLKCCQSTNSGEFHPKCAQSVFGQRHPPRLDTTMDELEHLAQWIISHHIALTGVQRKLSLTLDEQAPERFTIVGALGGNYILKPPSPQFPELPENEHLTMLLAAHLGIKTAANSLIRMADRQLAYITRRFDRVNGSKIALEDLCQLTETLTEHKYRGSHERVGKHIAKYSTIRGDDLLRFFELTVFCFQTGNADMHLKNFAMVEDDDDFVLSPAFDLLSTRLILSEAIDAEELALTLNGKKAKLTRGDFLKFASTIGLPERVAAATVTRLASQAGSCESLIKASFLAPAAQQAYRDLLLERSARLL